eukprot:Pgem_evm1s232
MVFINNTSVDVHKKYQELFLRDEVTVTEIVDLMDENVVFKTPTDTITGKKNVVHYLDKNKSNLLKKKTHICGEPIRDSAYTSHSKMAVKIGPVKYKIRENMVVN